VHYSLQANHALLIIEAQDQVALACGMKAIGARLARAVNHIAGRAGRVLADRYHHRLLATPREVHRALLRAVERAEARAAGSDGTQGCRATRHGLLGALVRWLETEPDRDRAREHHADPGVTGSVARARPRLLTVGWRRHGLLDPAEVPG
jgi:hypothetical protein